MRSAQKIVSIIRVVLSEEHIRTNVYVLLAYMTEDTPEFINQPENWGVGIFYTNIYLTLSAKIASYSLFKLCSSLVTFRLSHFAA